MSVMSVPGGRLEYIDVGRGPPLVLLHGGTGNIDEWRGALSHLSRRYRVVAYNRRGFGQSSSRTAFPFNYHEADVADLILFLDALGLSGPVRLCGFSDGATIVLMFAARFPQRVIAAVSIAGHIYVEGKTQRGLAKARTVFESRVRQSGRERDVKKIRSRRAWFDVWLDPRFRQSFNLEDQLAQITCPTLVVQGTEDEYADTRQAERIAQEIPGARLLLMEGARHWIHGGSHAEALLGEISTFLEGVQSESA